MTKAAPVIPTRKPTYVSLSPIWSRTGPAPQPHPAGLVADPTFDEAMRTASFPRPSKN